MFPKVKFKMNGCQLENSSLYNLAMGAKKLARKERYCMHNLEKN
jgi:hypothetical protein